MWESSCSMAGPLSQFMAAIGLGGQDDSPQTPLPPRPTRTDIFTERSTTVFAGTAEDWVTYLQRDWDQRFDGQIALAIYFDANRRMLGFEGFNERSIRWATWLGKAFGTLRKRLEDKPAVERVFDDMIFGNMSNAATPLRLLSEAKLPGEATREVRVDDGFSPTETRILVRTRAFDLAEGLIKDLPGNAKPMEWLGSVWPVLQRVLLQLAYPSYPRDRFIERIEITTQWALVNLHVLYGGKKDGKLDPTKAGDVYEALISRRERMERKFLYQRHPFFRLLSDLSFLLNERGIENLMEMAQVVVRDYLDSRYLRLSIAGLMPKTPDWMKPMSYDWKGKNKVRTSNPRKEHYGILDDEDLEAWNKVQKPLADIGYFIIGQLGMGQFGRVYEAVNVANGNIPARVAVKVDRIRKGHKKEAILAAETIMSTAHGLSRSPHVIRVFDAGNLKKERYTYHILQLVEGDTLDNLIGVTGTEHASILRPDTARSSEVAVREEFLAAVGASEGERWRKARQAHPFLYKPAITQMLDLLTSKALWVEEVHEVGYAVNDLKNGNVMINRRGQFKGIDLDSYSPIFSKLDKLPDFFFLAISALQLVTHRAGTSTSGLKAMITDPNALTRYLLETWPYKDLSIQSDGRVSNAEMAAFLVSFIENCRSGHFAAEHDAFSEAIDRLIFLKRSLAREEIILE